MKALYTMVVSTLGFATWSACAAQSTTTPAETPETSTAEARHEPSPVAAQQVEKEEPKVAAQLVFALEGLQKPESILYLEDEDLYLVSNVNGDPLATDGNGFISKVSPEGKIVDLKFIDGEKSGVSLNAPKGMAISDGTLYVADITWVRMFDAKTGASKGSIKAPGATFLNDVTIDAEGLIYVSDTGWKMGGEGEGYAKSGSDTVYRIDPKKVVAIAMQKDEEWGNPNGLAFTQAGVWAVTDQGELYQVTSEGKANGPTNLAKGGLDGVVALDDGSFVVSSWEDGAVYRGKPGEKFSLIIAGVPSPADMGYDSKRRVLLVPSMIDDRMLAFKLEDGQTAAVAPPRSAPNETPPSLASDAKVPEEGAKKSGSVTSSESSTTKAPPAAAQKK